MSPDPVGLAAVLLRIPLVLTEADSHLGLTNRLLARSRGASAWRSRSPAATAPRYRVTGRPVPPPATDRAGRARAASASARTSTCVLVFGGSLGARSINDAAVEAFAGGAVPRPARRGRARLRASCAERARRRRRDYDLREYIEHVRRRALAAADLVVARAGGSVFEIAAHGLPALLVPYPHATADHQTRQRALDGRRRRRGRGPRRRADRRAAGARGRGAARTTARRLARWRAAARGAGAARRGAATSPRELLGGRAVSRRRCAERALGGPARSTSSASAAPG